MVVFEIERESMEKFERIGLYNNEVFSLFKT